MEPNRHGHASPMLEDRKRGDAHRSILVVEDDADQQFVIRRTVESAGHRVEVVSTALDAYDLLARAEDHFDVAIVDLNLPDQGGSRTVEMLRDTTSIPLVVYSSAARMHLERAQQLGADACIAKTEDVRVLLRTIETIAGDHAPMLELPEASRDIAAEDDFALMAQQVVDRLSETGAISTWLVTRAIEDRWIVLAASDDQYGLASGDVLRWSDSFCSRMVGGRPRFIPDTSRDGAYTDAPIGMQIPIRSYVGLPLGIDGEGLFGTLCGISPNAHPDPPALARERPMYEVIAQVLAGALAIDLERNRLQRRLEIAENAARVDSLTGLGNRRAWERALRNETARCARFGHLAGVIMVDLDGLKQVNDTDGHHRGDEVLRDAATAIDRSLRTVDQAFRIGGDEFAVLLPETMHPMADVARQRLADTLEDAGIAASIGVAVGEPGADLRDVAKLADEAMYEEKRLRREHPVTAAPTTDQGAATRI